MKISIPKSVFIETDEFEDDKIKIRLDALIFPVIVKPRLSSIMAKSHDLVIVRDKDVLFNTILKEEKFAYLRQDTIIVQEYILNHYETLIKIYAIGRNFDVLFKPTFPLTAVEHFLKTHGYLEIG